MCGPSRARLLARREFEEGVEAIGVKRAQGSAAAAAEEAAQAKVTLLENQQSE